MEDEKNTIWVDFYDEDIELKRLLQSTILFLKKVT